MGVIRTDIAYPSASGKDQWTHNPAGGTQVERTKKEDTAHYEKNERPAPSTASLIESSTTEKDASVTFGWTPRPGDVVLQAILWTYCKQAVAEAMRIWLQVGTTGQFSNPTTTRLTGATSNEWVSQATTLTNLTLKEAQELNSNAEVKKAKLCQVYAWYVALEIENRQAIEMPSLSQINAVNASAYR